MLVTILSYLHHTTTLLFGVFISALFLGIRMNRRNVAALFGFACADGVVYILVFLHFGEAVTKQLYPLIVHLPLILFLTCFYKYKAVLCVISVLTAYLCCQISNWTGIAAMNLVHSDAVYYGTRIVVTVLVFILLFFMRNSIALPMQQSMKMILLFGLMPTIYYIFDYMTNVYTTLLYSGVEIIAEFQGFLLSIAYILFLVLYFRQYEKQCEAERRSRILEMQWMQSQREIESIHRSEHAVNILRHDMRHFLANISTLIASGETEEAQAYISELIDNTDKAIMRKYSKNEIVNIILSFYERQINNNEINFQYSIRVPEKLSFSDVDITAILSNGLENAIQAVLPLEPHGRNIWFDLHMNDSKLLLCIKNTFAEKPEFKNGVPQTREQGHGFGTQSIQYAVEKLKGNCRFSVEGNLFVLQVIL